MVRRPGAGFEAGFAAALRLAAQRFFIISDRRLRPAGVRRRFLVCFGAVLAVGVAVAVAAPPSISTRQKNSWVNSGSGNLPSE
jgi:hypothetical protein